MGHLEFEMTSPPVARQVVGEVSPPLATAGRETAFVYAFRPALHRGPGGGGVRFRPLRSQHLRAS